MTWKSIFSKFVVANRQKYQIIIHAVLACCFFRFIAPPRKLLIYSQNYWFWALWLLIFCSGGWQLCTWHFVIIEVACHEQSQQNYNCLIVFNAKSYLNRRAWFLLRYQDLENKCSGSTFLRRCFVPRFLLFLVRISTVVLDLNEGQLNFSIYCVFPHPPFLMENIEEDFCFPVSFIYFALYFIQGAVVQVLWFLE